ncbi:hypothetical protein GQ42DRAFT_163138 [Ramicandelaber brevisporus]|nr:hypothetical protein GQ42DRAFT_163138 [Ramicandelaber brevisporus]
MTCCQSNVTCTNSSSSSSNSNSSNADKQTCCGAQMDASIERIKSDGGCCQSANVSCSRKDTAEPQKIVWREHHDASDIGNLAFLETMFTELGFEDGRREGQRTGGIEGRAMGQDMAFELGREVGFMRGSLAAWKQLRGNSNGGKKEAGRGTRHVAEMEALLDAFPMRNRAIIDDLEQDVSNESQQQQQPDEQMNKLRTKFKVVAATCGSKIKYPAHVSEEIDVSSQLMY